MNRDYATLEKRFAAKNVLEHIIMLADWDAQLFCPENATDGRGTQKATLSLQCHDILTCPDWAEIFDRLHRADDLDAWQRANVRAAEKIWKDESVLPVELVEELSVATTKAVAVWFKARAENDFAAFRPHLEKLVALQRQAGALKNADNPYDALLDTYETGVTQAFVDPLFDDLKSFLPDFIARVRSKTPFEPFSENYPVDKQIAFCKAIMDTMGFDTRRGRLDEAKTAFCTTLGTDDVRVVSHFHTDDPIKGVRAVMHETGHALYEQHLPRAYAAQPVGKQYGMVMHESQSLLMECQVFQSAEFQRYLCKKMREFYGFAELTPESLRRKNYRVEPSFIRIDADEVTYPLHVILRYEIEKELIAGRLTVADLPAFWNEKMRQYLGITPKTDTQGCLQDIHWACGNFGYFPDYTLGALAAHQFFAAAVKNVPDALNAVETGDFKPLVGWLTENVYARGSFDTFADTVKKVTGSPLSADCFKATLEKRYG